MSRHPRKSATADLTRQAVEAAGYTVTDEGVARMRERVAALPEVTPELAAAARRMLADAERADAA